jgi:hypothetical protein
MSSAAGADSAMRGSRISPFAGDFGRSGPSQASPRTNRLCIAQHILCEGKERKERTCIVALIPAAVLREHLRSPEEIHP